MFQHKHINCSVGYEEVRNSILSNVTTSLGNHIGNISFDVVDEEVWDPVWKEIVLTRSFLAIQIREDILGI